MIRIVAGLLISLGCFAIQCDAQTATGPSLTDRLVAEGAGSLASAAREKGDAVRGAILFAKKSLACTTCHAQGATDLLGPDLTRACATPKRGMSNDEHFVESILEPSKVISEGFESVKILTESGRVITGRVIQTDEERVLLRELSDSKRLISIAQDDIERMDRDRVSAMPDKLADQLDDRQQFLDIVKYVMDIADTSQVVPIARPTNVATAKLDQRIQGLALLDRFGCVNCHASDSTGQSDATGLSAQSSVPSKRGPNLTESTSRIDPTYIRRFIANPDKLKPGTSMPGVMDHLADENRAEAAAAITHYLLSLSSESFTRQSIDSDSAQRGQELFHSVGCVACHSPRADDGTESMPASAVALGNLAPKYNLTGLSAFLEDPHSVRPSGRMPNMQLSHWEAADLASYLLQTKDTKPDRSIEPMRENVVVGQRYFVQLGCAQCHVTQDAKSEGRTTEGSVASDNPSRDYPPLSELKTDQGCLSSQPGAWPQYRLDDSQRDAIRSAIEKLHEPVNDRQQIVLTMETLRCYACHRRDGLGGISDERDVFFHTTNENLGPQGRIPPTLTDVGGKLQSKWLREVLVSGRSIRPYMKTRMPQYGTENVDHLVDLFAAVDPKPLVEIAESRDPKETKKIGTELVGNNGLNCIACHTFQQKPAQTMPAVDLTEMAERLHKEWFAQYMLAPQSLSPNTVMPSFWPGGKAIRKEIADGDSNRQIGAIWEYLLDGRQAREPRGLRREPIQLLASEGHAAMLRRSYRDIGKRGIGVGYPGGVNLAFDAEQMRLAMIWKGGFADPGGVWWSQGHGTVRPLGSDLIRFEAGPDLDDTQSPWVADTGRPPNHQFTGYYLDDADRPTFTYRFKEVDVEDYAIDIRDTSSGQTILNRTLKFTSEQPPQNLTFRVANGQKVIQTDDQTFRVNDALQVRVAGGHLAKIVGTETGQRLVIALHIPSGSTTLEIQYIW